MKHCSVCVSDGYAVEGSNCYLHGQAHMVDGFARTSTGQPLSLQRQFLFDESAARQLLESARIDWRRDWDAIAMGVLIGLLAGLLF